MSMDDWGWDAEGTEQKAAPGAILEPGRYTAQITKASWEKKPNVPEKWRAKNPEGWRVSVSLKVHHDGRSYQFWTDVPRHWQWTFRDIAAATGTPLPDHPDWQPSEWVGRDVDITTGIWESNAGPKIQVEKWHPLPEKPASKAAAKPAARTPAAAVAKARGDEPGDLDDCPF